MLFLYLRWTLIHAAAGHFVPWGKYFFGRGLAGQSDGKQTHESSYKSSGRHRIDEPPQRRSQSVWSRSRTAVKPAKHSRPQSDDRKCVCLCFYWRFVSLMPAATKSAPWSEQWELFRGMSTDQVISLTFASSLELGKLCNVRKETLRVLKLATDLWTRWVKAFQKEKIRFASWESSNQNRQGPDTLPWGTPWAWENGFFLFVCPLLDFRAQYIFEMFISIF